MEKLTYSQLSEMHKNLISKLSKTGSYDVFVKIKQVKALMMDIIKSKHDVNAPAKEDKSFA